RDDRRRPVDRDAPTNARRELRLRLNGRRSDELEEERRLADDDLAARLLAEGDLVGLRGPLRNASGLAAERGEIADARLERDPTAHSVEEVQAVVVSDELEEPEIGRHALRRKDEHALF